MTPRLRVDGLCIHGVGPVSMDVDAGICVGLSGPSGSGKTLFLRAIADMEPHGGAVYLDGTEQRQIHAPEWRRQVALLPAESLWWFDTAGEHFSRPDADRFHRLGLDPGMLTWPVSRLSSGERQRLALLRLLENDPGLLLLDEPTANLDPDNTTRVEKLVAGYREATGAAVLWVGHRREQLHRVASRVVCISGGRIGNDGGDR
ncbi:ATP-binding protein [Desulfosarcina alkanivorans]|uniref:ATP-binding protein n=1 Tax=Desulfosarcina alkanivorans TaxID=571177 RepID=A0A5K7Z6C6_9BACT|nr:ATP-binding cassette domain-containing protein [Desulfosarcina alkanivorans]BBO72127.1 ATP-binding protein [Desulfosarcina alkanivorans]